MDQTSQIIFTREQQSDSSWLYRGSDGRVWSRGNKYLEEFLASNTPVDVPYPFPTLEQRRQTCITALHTLRDQLQGSSFLFRTKPIQCRPGDVMNIMGMYTLHVIQTIPLPNGFAWRCADDTWLPLDAQGISELSAAYYTFKNACYQYCWFTLEPVINNSDNPESIDITQGWPT